MAASFVSSEPLVSGLGPAEHSDPLPCAAPVAEASRAPEIALPVVLATENAEFAERLGRELLGSALVELTVEPSPATMDLLVAVGKGSVLVIDAALLEIGAKTADTPRRHSDHNHQVILVFERVEESAVRLSLQVRAHGCIDFHIDRPHFERAVDAVVKGELWFPRCMMAPLYDLALSSASAPAGVAAGHSEDLTAREIDVLQLVQSGLTNKQVARQLSISPNTVKKHLHNALIKHGIQRRRQLYK
jgi:DNA-binding NarL/FixJ family response regulator